MMNGNGHQQPPQQQTFDDNTPIPITLPLNTWNLILTCLAEAPWKTADPLIKGLHAQIRNTLERNPQQQRPIPGPDLADRES